MKSWHERIGDAELRRAFTKEDVDLANDWVTCACGQQDGRIPRDAKGQPRDLELRILGAQFAAWVANDEDSFSSVAISAKRCLVKIEQRAAEVIRELEAESCHGKTD